MNFLELMYTRAATLLRDVFQYFVPGLLFLALLLPGLLSLYLVLQLASVDEFKLLVKMLDEYTLWTTIIFFIISYVIGQFLYSLSYPLFRFYKCICGIFMPGSLMNVDKKLERLNLYLKSIEDIVDETKAKIINDYLKKINDKKFSKIELEDTMHLYFEMTTFINKPELHARFIERYNVLMFMRRSLSSCLFVVGIIYLFLLTHESFFLILGTSLIMLLLSGLLFWQHEKTKVRFWERVFTGCLIRNEKVEEKE